MSQNDYILIVETNDLIRALLERWLREAGYAVVFKMSRKSLGSAPVDEIPLLMIVDIPHPRDMEPLVQSLQEVYPIPILAISTSFRRGLDKSKDAAAQLGVRKILPKPFTREELLSAVAEILDES